MRRMYDFLILTSPTTLEAGGKTCPCVIGRAGLVAAHDKREGDGKTPIGSFALRACFFRPDRVAPPPITGLPRIEMARHDGWCDDPAHPLYNHRVKLPFSGGHEALWRADHAYDLVIPLGYNDAPPVAGKGSAIFMHVMHDDGRPTAGCIALHRHDLLALLPHMGAKTMLTIA